MLTPYDFQKYGCNWLCSRSDAILADDMGLGKTLQVLEAIRKLHIESGLIVTPQSIRRSWVKRIREQIPEAFIKEMVTSKCIPDPMAFNVINYDIVWREPIFSLLRRYEWPVLVCDEFHFCKNIESKRTKAIFGRGGIHKNSRRRWMVSGTPLLNRPIELYPVLRSLFPVQLGEYRSYYSYAFKFCAAFKSEYGFDTSGASNLQDLARILAPVMLRRTKQEVMRDLPAVTYDKIYLDPTDQLIKLIEAEKKEFDARALIGEVSSVHRALGILKAHTAVKHLQDLLQDVDKVVVFIWHKDVARIISDAFPEESVLYTGAQSTKDKDDALHKFITSPKTRIFIGNVKSAGFGVDGLQRVCDTCVFVEMSYVPKEMEQAIDRLNRIGQDNPVQVQFLVAENSVDEQTINKITEKAKNINTILNERGDRHAQFVATKCGICNSVIEIEKLKRIEILKKSVCQKCKKEMECLL